MTANTLHRLMARHRRTRATTLRLFAGLWAVAMACALTTGAMAQQNLFSPVAHVNDSVVTRYELNQRIALGGVLAGGISQEDALNALIDERLRLQAAARAGVVASEEEIAQGIEEFAARGSLSTQELLDALGRRGVAAETLRDFVSAGLIWRTYIRARFASRVNVTEAEIDRALQQVRPGGGLTVAMSEIFLPARTPSERAQSERLAQRIASNATIGSFAAAARQYSVAPSRTSGGRIPSAPLGNLPPPLRTAIQGLSPGEVTAPLSTQNAIGIFQLRALSETDTPTPDAVAIEYAAYYIANGQDASGLAKAAKIKADIDTCDDLYEIAKGQPEEVLQIDTLPVGEIPNDVAFELAKLDPGEVSTALTRADGATRVLLMLCGRSYDASDSEAPDREALANNLRSSRLASIADSHLAELRADAIILID
ncbi:peptidylprolyl isomerase [Celeribacter arenosi]